MLSDEEMIAQHIATKGVTRIERPWPNAEIDGWAAQMNTQAKARVRGAQASARKLKKEGNIRAERLAAEYRANPTSAKIDELAAREGCTRGRLLELLRKAGHGLGTPRKKAQ